VENYYRILNVSPSTSPADIRKAIIKELRLWSNRTNAPQIERRQEAERMVQTLEEAERILLDPAKKADYDRKLQTTPEPTRQILDEDIGPAADLIAEGWRLLIGGQVADALYVATKATEFQGNNSEAWALLAQAKFRWGDIDDSIYEYRRAIKLKPNGDSYYFDLGSVYESVDKYKEAVENFEKAVRIKPQETMYRAAIGAVYVKLSMNKEAIDILEQCVREAPDNSSYQWALAIAYSERAYEGWTYVPAGRNIEQGYYATKKAQVAEAEAYVNKAAALRFEDPELSQHLAQVRTNITSMYARQFTGNKIAMVISGLIGVGALFGAMSGQAFLLFHVLWCGGGAFLYYKASLTPQYIINRRVLAGKGGSASMSLIADATNQEYGCLIAAGLFVMTAVFIPIMAAWNYMKNYSSND
jgi:tetratricopeptide (TPR) repeat protein